VRILSHVKGAIGAVCTPAIANSLGDGEDVCFGERIRKWRTPVPAGAEPDHLVGIRNVWPALEVPALEPGEVDQHLLWRRPAGERGNACAAACLYDSGHGFTPQMPDAYSAILRSLENLPEPATFRMAFRVHSSEFA
jgi:hypothetical protein